jgi:hypothetical protein
MIRLLLVVGLATLGGCPTDPPPACITVDTSCAPLYDATSFHAVYTMTIHDSCGAENSSCHSANGQKGGMTFQDEQHAFDALLAGRVMPNNPGCSKIVVRTSSPNTDYQMPPGDALMPPERCALIQWVQAGAQR